MASTVIRKFRIINDKGLHARASAKFVEVVEAHDARARVSKDGMDTEGDSIMGLLMLGGAYGSTIEVETSGNEAEALMEALSTLIADRFGEES